MIKMNGLVSFLSLVLLLASSGNASEYSQTHCVNGRTTIVHLFEWKWNDIAKECARFLGPMGYCGVQVSPPNENRVVNNRPWWERYQPVSYKLVTRSGNEDEFKRMVSECNKHGVRIYVDAVINHMTGSGGGGRGTGGTSFNADGNNPSFPGVPYGRNDFNDGSVCKTRDMSIHNYGDANEVRNCRLVGLLDLKLSSDYVRGKIAGYFNHLIDIGVAGIRIDAAKHMWPGDIHAVLGKTKNLRSDIYGGGKRMFVYQEVIDMGGNEPIKASQYTGNGRVTNFIFGVKMGELFAGGNKLEYTKNFGSAWGMPGEFDVVNFVDNHDNQRGHGGGGTIITHDNPRAYKMASAFMLSWPYGEPRVMSSFSFSNSDQGPPNNNGNINDVGIKSDNTCSGGWVCEHRWRQIYNMVSFRNIAGGAPVANWWKGASNQIAFSRGNKAFIAFNREGFDLNADLNTGLPSGTYCDIISGNMENGRCTGTSIQVGGNGRAHIHISHSSPDPMVAIHVGQKLGGSVRRTG